MYVRSYSFPCIRSDVRRFFFTWHPNTRVVILATPWWPCHAARKRKIVYSSCLKYPWSAHYFSQNPRTSSHVISSPTSQVLSCSIELTFQVPMCCVFLLILHKLLGELGSFEPLYTKLLEKKNVAPTFWALTLMLMVCWDGSCRWEFSGHFERVLCK